MKPPVSASVLAALLLPSILCTTGNSLPFHSQYQQVGEDARRTIGIIRTILARGQPATQTAEGAGDISAATDGQFGCLDKLAVADYSGDVAFCNNFAFTSGRILCPASCSRYFDKLDEKCKASMTSGPRGESFRRLFLACNTKLPRRMKYSLKLEYDRTAKPLADAPSYKSKQASQGRPETRSVPEPLGFATAPSAALDANSQPEGFMLVPPDVTPNSDYLLYEGPSSESPEIVKGLQPADAPADSPDANVPEVVNNLQPSEDQAAPEGSPSVTMPEAEDGAMLAGTPNNARTTPSTASQLGRRLLPACSIITAATLIFFT